MSGAVLSLGATTGIGRAVARELARTRRSLVVAGRDLEELQTLAADLRVRHGVGAVACRVDARAGEELGAFFRECVDAAGGRLEGVVLCFGYAGSQQRAESDWEEAVAIIETNYLSAVRLLNLAADHLKEAGAGFICGITSVAGDRGRQSNYIYGSAKAALGVYLQGLRDRLSGAGVTVTTIKPGFVDTPMTVGRPGLRGLASPQRVARVIRRAIERGRAVVYVPWLWRWIMLLLRLVPERIFRRLRL